MLTPHLLHDPNLGHYEPEGVDVDLSVRNYLLFALIDEKETALTGERYLVEASNYYNKLCSKC